VISYYTHLAHGRGTRPAQRGMCIAHGTRRLLSLGMIYLKTVTTKTDKKKSGRTEFCYNPPHFFLLPINKSLCNAHGRGLRATESSDKHKYANGEGMRMNAPFER
jgi:hypothetical protein